MVDKQITEILVERLSRRAFLAKAGGAALGLTLSFLGLPSSMAEAACRGTQCPDYNCVGCLKPACCVLGYDHYCSNMNCFIGCGPPNDWWAWSCRDNNGHYWTCWECCSQKCSAVTSGLSPQAVLGPDSGSMAHP
jgi:hypothetical protein